MQLYFFSFTGERTSAFVISIPLFFAFIELHDAFTPNASCVWTQCIIHLGQTHHVLNPCFY